ncbi:MAG: HAD hydrolase-like protein [Betaproteobacteria bacterium]|nr:HAD hydrolase-like protein [Betaproteobacteria bacterium]
MAHRTALLFDLDGTLTDPKEGITKCIAHALQRMGATPPPLDELHFAIGPPLRPTFGRLLKTDDRERIEVALAAYRERFATVGLFENALYANIRESLLQAQKMGHRLFLATSKPHVYATRILDHFELSPLFSGIYGCELDGRRDDKGELIAHLLATEALDPACCRMFGDRKHDVIGAAKNGIESVGVTWGYGSAEELTNAGARVLCHAPGDLPRHF